MSLYCFADRPRDLWDEVFSRGYVVAVRDYPHVLSFEESTVAAHAVPGELRHEVCCIPPDEYAYLHLVTHAWAWGYLALSHTPENRIARAVLAFKPMPLDEAFRLARVGLCVDERAYPHYQALIARLQTA